MVRLLYVSYVFFEKKMHADQNDFQPLKYDICLNAKFNFADCNILIFCPDVNSGIWTVNSLDYKVMFSTSVALKNTIL